MPAPRRYKGIKKVEIGTVATSLTELPNLAVSDAGVPEAGVTFEPHGDSTPKTPYGNNYGGPDLRQYRFNFLDRSSFDTYRAGHIAKTKYFFQFTLDNDETHITTEAIQFEELRHGDMDGAINGRGDVFHGSIRVPKFLITETTA